MVQIELKLQLLLLVVQEVLVVHLIQYPLLKVTLMVVEETKNKVVKVHLQLMVAQKQVVYETAGPDMMEEMMDPLRDWYIKYREREGDANVPNRHVESGEALGGWLSRQRAAIKVGLLSEQRLRRLEPFRRMSPR